VRGEEAQHGRPAGEPGRCRGHLQRDVLAQQLGQRAGVGVLEGGGELLKRIPQR
jgi:hypothetical protein